MATKNCATIRETSIQLAPERDFELWFCNSKVDRASKHVDRPQLEGVIMAVNALNQNLPTRNRILAFFADKDDAYSAVSALKEASFTSDEIGLIDRNDIDRNDNDKPTKRNPTDQNEGVWEKIKNFFSGDSPEDVDYRDTSTGLDWDQSRGDYYYRGLARGGAVVSVVGARLGQAREILQRQGGDTRDSGYEGTDESAKTGQENEAGDNEEDYRIQLRGEVLRTFRERVQRGEVRLRKEVVTENQTVEVPVTREELVVERVPVSGQRAAEEGEIGGDHEIRVTLSEEQARMEKEPIVKEEVRVGKRKVQKTEIVSGDVRHEKLRVDKDGDVDVDTQTVEKRKNPAA
jgi:uncharacterized protein (TIGR02271 family)